MGLVEVTCPDCNNKILRKSHDGQWRFRTMVIRVTPEGDQMIAVCKGCKKEIPLPYGLIFREAENTLPSVVQGKHSVVKNKSQREDFPTSVCVVQKKNA